jgi:hypothetical protein
MNNKERWLNSSIAFQLGNIGSEICRARLGYEQMDEEIFKQSLERALELIDLTLSGRHRQGRLREFCRLREIVADWYCQSKVYQVSFESIEEYCTQLITAQRMKK